MLALASRVKSDVYAGIYVRLLPSCGTSYIMLQPFNPPYETVMKIKSHEKSNPKLKIPSAWKEFYK